MVLYVVASHISDDILLLHGEKHGKVNLICVFLPNEQVTLKSHLYSLLDTTVMSYIYPCTVPSNFHCLQEHNIIMYFFLAVYRYSHDQ